MNGNTLSLTPTHHYPALFLTLLIVIVMYVVYLQFVCTYVCNDHIHCTYKSMVAIISVLVVQVFEGSVSVIYDDSAQTVSIEASHVTIHLIT